MRALRGALALAALTVASLAMIPVQWLALRYGWPVRTRLPLVWHRIATRLVGIRIHQRGHAAVARPLLITANHASWVDITVLGAVMPLSFIAKSEVEGWPVFGLLARLQRTVFVNRTRRSETGDVADRIAERIGVGDVMVLFAEGTSNDGNGVLPFRSALLGAATRALAGGRPVHVQPLSIAYTHLQGLPMDRRTRPHVAWYGDMELPGHLWAIVREGALDVTLTWGEPVVVDAGTDRKELTLRLQREVALMTASALLGRPVNPEPVAAEAPAAAADRQAGAMDAAT
ncbi:1-acyl-sn-glycerol-3-phosphate acyltransferase [Microvirga tunisiensis]|uniref:1-acyl-sn-glycerol-3-phosphate acyltransferase n=1 Tax=Pannonibacter tanglangensis TaxID=2750084 RepID=A0A7X5F598_9HYPH|nr:lysophospholipid acyltransferase family protein [Pannonibacter sp. XCT-53]NBN80030.1 1-acyl-sn-glycerol-3-phosphate acyltransferase [Pannonibacter sp. XCT-53]